jgi:pyruvate,water dikinase
MSSRRTSFPLPSEVCDVPGAEGWEKMYPYFTRFTAEDDKKFWFYNAMHFPEPMPPFDVVTAEIPYQALGAFTNRVFVFPTTLGVEHRILNGRIYITANPVTDGEEIGRRLGLFQERAGYYYQNWNRLYEEWKARMSVLIEDLKAIKVPALPEFDDIEVVHSGRGYAQNDEVRTGFNRTIEGFAKMWQYHFEMLMLGYGAYVVFFQFCKQLFPEIADQTVSRMVAGIDVLMFRPDEELKSLARLAVKLGLSPAFIEGTAPATILEAIRNSGSAGAEWLAALDAARDPWFHISTGDGFYHHHRSWNDDPSVPFSALTRYIAMLNAGRDIQRPTDRLKAERQRIIAEYRALIATEEERGAFDQMLGLCHLVFPFVEDHKFLCEHWYTTLFYAKIREFGALLARWGLIADPEDVFMLNYQEIEQALVEVTLAWAAGSQPKGGAHWRPIVKDRRRILEKLKEWDAPAALGPVPEQINDPALLMLWGITSETLQSWLRLPEDANDERTVRGFAASPGVVEGVARVLKNVNDIGLVQEGDILVCPVTNPSWGPVFGKIRAAVSDIGGTMSHAAIVAREYGMPAVVGTGVATKRFRTGQRLRVDGNSGVVTVLD